ncbi:hypothetical protein F4677DRAFT_76875 [Hypoxylon crocopeplum]|nr:hypothetical protein F4677DRAFT_76875 [Hypoxylon crocopeplum]
MASQDNSQPPALDPTRQVLTPLSGVTPESESEISEASDTSPLIDIARSRELQEPPPEFPLFGGLPLQDGVQRGITTVIDYDSMPPYPFPTNQELSQPEESKPRSESDARKEAEATEEEANNHTILDRHNRTIAEILKRFNNLVMAATAPIPETGNILERAVANSLTIQTECNALVCITQTPSPSPRPLCVHPYTHVYYLPIYPSTC